MQWWPCHYHGDWNTCQYGFQVPGQQGIQSAEGSGTLEIAPVNPSTGVISIHISGTTAEYVGVEIFSLDGRLAHELYEGTLEGDLQLE